MIKCRRSWFSEVWALWCTLKLWVGSGMEELSALLSIRLVCSTSTQGGPPTPPALLMDLHLIQRHVQVGYPSLPAFITPLWSAVCLPRLLPLPPLQFNWPLRATCRDPGRPARFECWFCLFFFLLFLGQRLTLGSLFPPIFMHSCAELAL